PLLDSPLPRVSNLSHARTLHRRRGIMIKVTVMYPNQEGTHFDIDYYCTKHMPLARRLVGPALLNVSVDEGFAGSTPDSPRPTSPSAIFISTPWHPSWTRSPLMSHNFSPTSPISP